MYRFAHLTFQEYFVAEYCLRAALEDEHFTARWRELACPGGPQSLVERGWWQQTLQMFGDLCEGTGERCRALRAHVGESFLDLSDEQPELRLARIADENIVTIGSLLNLSESVTVVDFTNACSITDGGISSFCRAAGTLRNLRDLDLSHNLIGPAGCLALAELVGSTPGLVSLCLADNALCQGELIDDPPPVRTARENGSHFAAHTPDLSGWRALTDAIATHPALLRVELRGNFLTVEAGALLAAAAAANVRLEECCGLPMQQLRAHGITELSFDTDPAGGRRGFGGAHSNGTFLSTGGAFFVVEMLERFPQPSMTSLALGL